MALPRLFAVIAAFAALTVAAPTAAAMSVTDVTLWSPITRQPFPVQVPSQDQVEGSSLADLGADIDGCRHTSLQSEYDLMVVTDPYSYFTALASEWHPRTGQFLYPLTPAVKAAVARELEGDRVMELQNAYKVAQMQARAQGRAEPEHSSFIIPQDAIAIETKYQLALRCYGYRQARWGFMGKVALTGAWAIRVRLNVPLRHSALDGGYQEVEDKVKRQIKPGEKFNATRSLAVMRDVFADSSLTNEGHMVAGMVYFGLALREGDLKECTGILEELRKRFEAVLDEKDKPNVPIFRGFINDRRRMGLKYNEFLEAAATNLTQGIANEEFNRSQLPSTLLAVAECHRRRGNSAQAMDWYLALGKIPETQPKMRADIRKEGKAPSPDAPFHVQLGWIADEQYAKLTKAGVVHSGRIAGPDAVLLGRVVSENLGSSEYVSPEWVPVSNGTQADCQLMLERIGKAVVTFAYQNQVWPRTLGEMWDRGVIDRLAVNRFRNPVDAKPFLYQEIATDLKATPLKTVVVATSEPVPTNLGKRYGCYLLDNSLAWTEQKPIPGKPVPGE